MARRRSKSVDYESGMGFDALRIRHIERIAEVLIGHGEEGSGGHTRLFDTLIPDCFVFLGASRAWYQQEGRGRHREHVVPCRTLRDTVALMVRAAGGGPVGTGLLAEDERKAVQAQAVELLSRRLGIVYLTKDEAKRLDRIEGLKTGMPPGWDWTDDAQYLLRLEAANIDLVPHERVPKRVLSPAPT